MLEKRNLVQKITDIFVSHPKSCGESYFQHARAAGGYGFKLMVSGMAAIVHAILPFLFQTTASRTIEKIHADLARRKLQD